MEASTRPHQIADRVYDAIGLVLPERPTKRRAKHRHHKPEDETKARQEIREHNSQRQKADTEAEYIREPEPSGQLYRVVAEGVAPGKRNDVRLRIVASVPTPSERSVALTPIYRQLVNLCWEENPKRAQFIEAYTDRLWLNNSLSGDDGEPRGVSREELAELIAQKPWEKSIRTAYYWLDWAYRLFAEWACRQYLAGRIFTPGELAPMVVWLRSRQNENEDETCENCTDVLN